MLAVDVLANIEPLVLTDDRRSIATEARVRIVHGSPSAGNVDIYVAAPGTDINTINPTFANVPFKANTGYVGLTGATYDVSVTPAGAEDPGGDLRRRWRSQNGDIFTAIARDATGGGGPAGPAARGRDRQTDRPGCHRRRHAEAGGGDSCQDQG